MKNVSRNRVLTLIINSDVTPTQNATLDSYVATLDEKDTTRLVTIFESEPRSIALYADYINELMSHTSNLTNEALEQIMTKILVQLQ